MTSPNSAVPPGTVLECSPVPPSMQGHARRPDRSVVRLDEAAAIHKETLKMRPDYERAHFILGALAVKRGLLDEAAGHYKNALRAEPGSIDAYIHLGEIREKQGRRG